MVSNTPWSVQATRTAVNILNRKGQVIMSLRPANVDHPRLRGYVALEQLIEAATVIVRQANELSGGQLVTINVSYLKDEPKNEYTYAKAWPGNAE